MTLTGPVASRWPHALPDNRAYSLMVDAIEEALRDDVALLVMAANVTLEQFQRQHPGILRTLARRGASAALDYLESGRATSTETTA